jgi:hypothetical protein
MSKAILLLLLVAFTFYSYNQNTDIFKPDSVRKEMEAVQISTSLHIDGLMDEPEWKLARPSPRVPLSKILIQLLSTPWSVSPPTSF